MRTIDNILSFIDLLGISERKFEQETGLSNGTLYAASKSNSDISIKNIEKIVEKFSKELKDKGFEIVDLSKHGGKGYAINIASTNATDADGIAYAANEPKEVYNKLPPTSKDISMQAIINLTESNRLLAEAHKEFAEANKILAKNNEELIRILKAPDKSTVDVVAKRGSIALATTAALQDILFERLAPTFGMTKEELDETLRNKVSVYRNLDLASRSQNM